MLTPHPGPRAASSTCSKNSSTILVNIKMNEEMLGAHPSPHS